MLPDIAVPVTTVPNPLRVKTLSIGSLNNPPEVFGDDPERKVPYLFFKQLKILAGPGRYRNNRRTLKKGALDKAPDLI